MVQSEAAALYLSVKSGCHEGLCIWNACMMVNRCYIHYGHMHASHFITIVVTCIIDVC